MRSQTWWYTARAGGIVAWALASLAVVGGLQLSTRLVRRPAPSWVLDVHRFLGGAVGGVRRRAPPRSRPRPLHRLRAGRDFLVPFVSSYKPAAVALGVVAMYLLLAIEITSLAMRRMPRRTWHAVHLTSYRRVRRRDHARPHRRHRSAQRRLPVGLPAHGGPCAHDDARTDLVAASRRAGTVDGCRKPTRHDVRVALAAQPRASPSGDEHDGCVRRDQWPYGRGSLRRSIVA